MASATARVPGVALGPGVDIPRLGLGVFLVPPGRTAAVVGDALEAGYRHIDTAAAYGNEAGVGEAVRASGLPRDEVFVTTKCFNDDHGHAEATAALEASLARLGLDHVDLYLIHWPVPARDRYVETWRALVDARGRGLTRAIGVSNFLPGHLRRLVDETGVSPSINQIELHPGLQQRELRAEHRARGIVTEAWSPLGQARALRDPVIGRIAHARRRTPAQVVIRWHLQLGNVVIPKSVSSARMRENLDVLDFELGEEDMQAIGRLDAGRRIGPHPETFGGPGRVT